MDDDASPSWVAFLFGFNGLASRSQYWLLRLCCAVLCVTTSLGLVAVLGKTGAALPNLGISLVNLWIVFATDAKRWHDRGKSAWWIAFSCIPILGWIWGFVECGFLPSKPEGARFA